METQKDKVWHLGYYHGYPNVRVQFEVVAKTFEEAVMKGNEAVANLRRTETWEEREIS